MIPMHRSMRPLLVAAVAFALVASASGCHWFKRDSSYAKSKEDRPLEVPPDLDLPDTTAATALPSSATASGTSSSTLRNADVLVPGAAATALYPKIGAALGGIEGVTINGRDEALSSYDVTYKGENFLIRAQDSQTGGSRLIAVSADGRLLNTGAGADLLKLVRAKL